MINYLFELGHLFLREHREYIWTGTLCASRRWTARFWWLACWTGWWFWCSSSWWCCWSGCWSFLWSSFAGGISFLRLLLLDLLLRFLRLWKQIEDTEMNFNKINLVPVYISADLQTTKKKKEWRKKTVLISNPFSVNISIFIRIFIAWNCVSFASMKIEMERWTNSENWSRCEC